ncbi:MAG: hypothetical protein IPO15_24190 [Anaerolineae bacterium]|uniref:hypothetical protein n=1 Tax=Candidatus Amarolinea dominans TaxID=3140696 RepID=UPI003136B79C|nr:hypothetical protein [Anaerolineae bacterium]
MSFEAGLAQLCGYLSSEGRQTGYFVVFHARPGVYGQLPDERLEFTWEQGMCRFSSTWCAWKRSSTRRKSWLPTASIIANVLQVPMPTVAPSDVTHFARHALPTRQPPSQPRQRAASNPAAKASPAPVASTPQPESPARSAQGRPPS